MRGDMINTFKVMNNKYDIRVTENLFQMASPTKTKGHYQKLYKKHCRLDVRKHFISQRTINVWNSLPQYVVDANTVKQFEILFDEQWREN